MAVVCGQKDTATSWVIATVLFVLTIPMIDASSAADHRERGQLAASQREARDILGRYSQDEAMAIIYANESIWLDAVHAALCTDRATLSRQMKLIEQKQGEFIWAMKKYTLGDRTRDEFLALTDELTYLSGHTFLELSKGHLIGYLDGLKAAEGAAYKDRCDHWQPPSD